MIVFARDALRADARHPTNLIGIRGAPEPGDTGHTRLRLVFVPDRLLEDPQLFQRGVMLLLPLDRRIHAPLARPLFAKFNGIVGIRIVPKVEPLVPAISLCVLVPQRPHLVGDIRAATDVGDAGLGAHDRLDAADVFLGVCFFIFII